MPRARRRTKAQHQKEPAHAQLTRASTRAPQPFLVGYTCGEKGLVLYFRRDNHPDSYIRLGKVGPTETSFADENTAATYAVRRRKEIFLHRHIRKPKPRYHLSVPHSKASRQDLTTPKSELHRHKDRSATPRRCASIQTRGYRFFFAGMCYKISGQHRFVETSTPLSPERDGVGVDPPPP